MTTPAGRFGLGTVFAVTYPQEEEEMAKNFFMISNSSHHFSTQYQNEAQQDAQ